jgi:hypothetical protein
LRSKLAPHCICNGEDSVYLSRTEGLSVHWDAFG